MSKQRRPSAAVIRIVCAMALIVLGFAHKPVFAEPRVPDLAVYVLPDGTIASICAPDHDQEPSGRIDKSCEACRLVTALLLPVPPAIALRAELPAPNTSIERETLVFQLIHPPGSGPRAPPQA